MENNNIKEYLLPHVFNAAIAGGAAIMEIYNSNADYDISLKSDQTPITQADRAAHNTIKEKLGPTRIPILSEEGREMEYEERRNWEMFWLVDPLDGTVEFISKNNEFTVNIALLYQNEIVAGVIYVPYYERLYYAAKDCGAFLCEGVKCDKEPNYTYPQITDMSVRLPRITEPRDVQRVAVSRSHTTPETLEYIEALRAQHPDLEVVEQGSSYKFCILADGEVDYYIRTTQTYEWDTAAGEIILAEAGGKTCAVGSNESLKYNKEQPQNPDFWCHSVVSKIR